MLYAGTGKRLHYRDMFRFLVRNILQRHLWANAETVGNIKYRDDFRVPYNSANYITTKLGDFAFFSKYYEMNLVPLCSLSIAMIQS